MSSNADGFGNVEDLAYHCVEYVELQMEDKELINNMVNI